MTDFKEKKVKIIWGSNKDTPVYFANQLQISHAGGGEFHITFGHLVPPLTHGLEEKDIPDTLEINTLFTIVISPKSMKDFVSVLVGNLKTYDEKAEDKKNDN